MMAVTELPDQQEKWVHQVHPVAMDLRDEMVNPAHLAQASRESRDPTVRMDYMDQLVHLATTAETESLAWLVRKDREEMLDTKDQAGRKELTARKALMAT
jgi:hypothetical protein